MCGRSRRLTSISSPERCTPWSARTVLGNPPLAAYSSGGLISDEGSLAVSGVDRRFASPREAMAAGIAIIPQELQLVASLTVAENVALGREVRLPNGLVNRNAARVLARRELDGVGAAHISADTPVALLTPGDRQLVAIAKALAAHARCLIMDEPTAALGVAEETRLERVIRSLVAAGTGIVYVSHKLDEVLRLATRVTVMRDGKKITTLAASQLTARELVRLMVGRDIPPSRVTAVSPNARELLRVDQLSVARRSEEAGATLRNVSLAVRAGEVVGLAGLVGAGRTDFFSRSWERTVARCAAASGSMDTSIPQRLHPKHARRDSSSSPKSASATASSRSWESTPTPRCRRSSV